MCVEIAPIAIPIHLECEHSISYEFTSGIQGGTQQPAGVVTEVNNNRVHALIK